MRKDMFKRLLGSLLSLSDEQLDLLLSAAHERRQMNQGAQALESSRAGLGCPHCAAQSTVKNGRSWLAALLLPLQIRPWLVYQNGCASAARWGKTGAGCAHRRAN